MERIEVIEEKPMIKRLVGKFISYMFLYGLLYLGVMMLFIIIALFLNESLLTVIIMCLVNLGINSAFIFMLSKSAICNAFEGINTVNVPNKSRHRILKIAAILMLIFMVGVTIVNLIAFHSLFTSKIQVNTYTIETDESIMQVRLNTIYKYGIFSNVKVIEDNSGIKTYSIFARTYSIEAEITFLVMIILNIFIGIWGITYENNLLKRYLIP